MPVFKSNLTTEYYKECFNDVEPHCLIEELIAYNITNNTWGRNNLSRGANFSDATLLFYDVLFKLTAVLFLAIMLIGVIGNALVVYVILAKGKMRTVINLLLLNLALSDIAFLIITVPLTAYHWVSSNWELGDIVCKMMHFFLYVTAYVTVYTLVLISGLRYVTVVYNRGTAHWRTKRNACFTICIVWAVMLIVNVPALLVYRVKVWKEYYYCGLEDASTGRKIYLSFFSCAYVIPLLIISVMYAALLGHLRGNRSCHTEEYTEEGALRQGQGQDGIRSRTLWRTAHATKLIILVVVVFTICWFPLHIHLVLAMYNKSPKTDLYQVFRIFWHCLAYANSCMNPIIYNYICKDFRNSFREACFLCRDRGTKAPSSRSRQLTHQSVPLDAAL